MAFNSGTAPLSQELPWSTDDHCILVTDSVETDGRFLLHTIASQALNSNRNVCWLSCGPVTGTLISTALRKIGCEAAAAYLKLPKSTEWKHPLAIHCVMVDLPNSHHDAPTYLKNLYHRLKDWCSSDPDNATTIIVDDVSALGNMMGERLVYFFISYLRSLPNCTVALRCSNDADKESHQEEHHAGMNSSRKMDWVGAGGRRMREVTTIPWERTLVEFADWVVDVVPLASGYSRETHGRLVFTARTPTLKEPLVMNYCLQDTGVSVIRLRS
jgi:Elongator subunit Iki1